MPLTVVQIEALIPTLGTGDLQALEADERQGRRRVSALRAIQREWVRRSAAEPTDPADAPDAPDAPAQEQEPPAPAPAPEEPDLSGVWYQSGEGGWRAGGVLADGRPLRRAHPHLQTTWPTREGAVLAVREAVMARQP